MIVLVVEGFDRDNRLCLVTERQAGTVSYDEDIGHEIQVMKAYAYDLGFKKVVVTLENRDG